MENIIKNPGFHHLVEKIFLNLKYEDLKKCQLINQTTNQILENPMFWMKKLIQSGFSLSEENQKDWIKAIQSERNSEKERHILAYLKWKLSSKECRRENRKIVNDSVC